jgi:alkanesulfonate monooxygenase SsuD/methylene tetrahydromethanopterin reductase-like flavin-dependent oxidoreductase (luciferase family)
VGQLGRRRDHRGRGARALADPARVHSIDHQGAHFQVKGPLNVPRSPQGRPVIVQAGSSEGGKALGSRHADAIFTTQTTLDDGIAFYTEMKARARAWGRDPDHLKIMPGISTVIGSTEEEAIARCDALDAFQGEGGLLAQTRNASASPQANSIPMARCRSTGWARWSITNGAATASGKRRSASPAVKISPCASFRAASGPAIAWWSARPSRSRTRWRNGSWRARPMAST